MSAYSEYSKLFKDGISTAAKEMGYSQSNICILEGTIEELQSNFPEVYSNLISCNYNKDSRTPLEYGRDLVASWIFEDVLIAKLRDAGLNISLAGADQKREILRTAKVSANSDCEIEINGKYRAMEIMCDYKGWWSKKGVCDLRDFKYNELVNTKSLFLGVSTFDIKCFVMDFSTPQNAVYRPMHLPYGGKPAYSIKVPPMMKFDINLICAEIKRLFGIEK